MRKKAKRETVLDKLSRLLKTLRRMTRTQMVTAKEADRILQNAMADALRRPGSHAT